MSNIKGPKQYTLFMFCVTKVENVNQQEDNLLKRIASTIISVLIRY